MKRALGNISVRVVQQQDAEKVIDFIYKYFYRDEPLSSCEPKIVPGETDRKDIMKCINAGTSIMMVEETPEGENLVAINIAIVKQPSSVQDYFDAAEKEGKTKYGNMLKFIGECNKRADLFNRYGVSEILYSFYACVHPDYRGHKLGTILKEELMNLGRRLGYKVCSGDFSSYYSAKLVKEMGWELCNTILYKDYVDENGQQIFVIDPPHVGFNTYAVRL